MSASRAIDVFGGKGCNSGGFTSGRTDAILRPGLSGKQVKMRTRDFGYFLAIEAFAIVWAGTLFTVLPSKLLAGGLAGAYFLFSGLYMIWRMRSWPARWRSPTWYILLIQVVVISLPMLISRYMQMELSFADVRILGLPGPVFHKLSNFVFSALIGATVIDLVRTKRAPKDAL
jgi:hypothetical protein